MQTAKGKLTNKDSGDVLKFSINPADLRLSRQFDFNVEGAIGQHAPTVSFRSGGASILSFQLYFDKDVDKDCNIKTVDGFIRGLNKVDEEKKTPPHLEFAYGSFRFLGHATSFNLNTTRFDDHGEPTSVSIGLTLISTGEYENGK